MSNVPKSAETSRRNEKAINYYGIKTFKWTEKEYSIRDVIENYSEYLPFVLMITEGYSSSRLEMADGEVYWIPEVTTQQCVVVKDHRGKYFSIPDCYQDRVVPLKEESPGYFVSASNGITLDQFRNQDRWRYFRFLGTYSKEVFDGADEGKIMKIGRLEIVDTFDEKFLVGHPVLGQPYVEMKPEIRRIIEETFTGAIYPVVTLIPAYIPIMATIAVCMNGKCDHKFFKAMLELKTFANLCDHDYSKLLEKDAEIMLFNKPPVDNVYDYIQMVPMTRDTNAHRLSEGSGKIYSAIDTDSSDSDYEIVDDKREASHSLSHRLEPIAYSSEMNPIERLTMLKEVYKTGILPPDTDPVEKPPSKDPPRQSNSSPGPALPKRGYFGEHHRSPPPLPPSEPTKSSRKQKTPPPTKTKPKVSAEVAEVYQDWRILKPTATSKQGPASVTRAKSVEEQQTSGPIVQEHPTPMPKQPILVRNEDGTPPNSKCGDPVRYTRSPCKEETHMRITTLQDIPSDVSQLSVSSLMNCLQLLNMTDHVPALERSLVDGALLSTLTEDLLIENFNFNKFDANKLIRFSKGWRPKLK